MPDRIKVIKRSELRGLQGRGREMILEVTGLISCMTLEVTVRNLALTLSMMGDFKPGNSKGCCRF
jgi:hypothetical protein